MKTSRFFVTVIVLATTMVSCNVNDDIEKSNPLEVRFTSGITAPHTKSAIDGSGNSVWETGDPVGIYMLEHSTSTVSENAENIPYTAYSPGASTSFTPSSTPIYYPLDETKKIDFIAYHPYNASVSNFVYQVNVSNQASQTAIDLMYGLADKLGAGYDKNDGRSNTAINFTFNHRLVKLIFSVAPGSGAPADLSTMSVSINGMNTTASFDLTGATGITGIGTPDSITPFKQTGVYTYEAILLPEGTLGSNHTVTFSVGGETYTWSMSNNIGSLEAGKIYTYDISLDKYAVNVTGNINKWTVGSTGSGSAE